MKKFVRTRGREPPSPPAPHYTNGHATHANGAAGARHDEQHSALSRYWSGSEECATLWEDPQLPPPWEHPQPPAALWEDPEFPADARALGTRRGDVQWRRPHELCANPTFFGEHLVGDDGAGADDDRDGDCDGIDELGADRWCAAGGGALACGALWRACAALARTPRLLQRAAPPHSFRAGYCGRFRFRFWVWSSFREVCVDDRLPQRAGRPLAAAPAQRDFTLPLLEKAYAKLYGSYAALRGVSVAQALQDVTGGVVQSFALRPPRRLALHVLQAALPRATLLVASAARAPAGGLAAARPYCVTGLARLRGAADGALLRLRAPAGGAWTGAWAAGSAELAALPAHDRDLLAADEDEFWMSFADFSQWFSRLELVHVGPDDWLREPALRARRPWRAVLARRRWRRGYNAGGPPGAPTAHANPQFHVQITGERKCHVVVAVAQEYTPAQSRRLLAVGFAVYALAEGAPARPRSLRALRPLDVTHESRAREVATFFTLPAGRYLVVPHTRRAHAEAAFLLRVLTDEHAAVWELNDDNVLVRDVWRECGDEPRAAPAAARAAADRMLAKLRTERADSVDAQGLRALLRRWGRPLLPARPSLELCRALVALRDPAVSGRLAAHELPALTALLAFWRQALQRELVQGACGAARGSAYRLRALLRAAGVSASNKVLECVVLRFARGAELPPAAALLALARLHLAHERYRSLDAKMKTNPLSLEEMILMTIYS